MARLSLNIINLNNLIIFYWIFFYLTQFTFVGTYFNEWFVPNSYLVILLGFSVIFFSAKIKKLSLYMVLALFPLFVDIILDLGYINYWLFAVKYLTFFAVINVSYSLAEDPFLKGTKYLHNFYLISFLISLPFLFGLEILPELDPTILRKNDEGNGFKNLYTVTPFFSSYLTGDVSISLLNIRFYRFTSFHIEPSNFTQFFVPLTIICWPKLNLPKKIITSVMILLSFSVTTFVLLPVIFLFKYLYLDQKRLKFEWVFLFTIGFIFAVYSSFSYLYNETSIGQLVQYKLFQSSSIQATYSTLDFFERLSLLGRGSFNKLPSQFSDLKMNLFSFVFWLFYLILIIIYSVRNKKSNMLSLFYFLLHGLKSINHIYPSFFLLYLLFNKRDQAERTVTRKFSENRYREKINLIET